MMIERLQAYRRRSKVLPKRVVIFRDGVSEVRLRTIKTPSHNYKQTDSPP